jgi:hypothetical protein
MATGDRQPRCSSFFDQHGDRAGIAVEPLDANPIGIATNDNGARL